MLKLEGGSGTQVSSYVVPDEQMTFVLRVVLAIIFKVSLSGSSPITTGILNFSRNSSVARLATSKPSTKNLG
jgi:hypothetical protein